jgi:lambda repressor-like predicted transcriptional regulator
MTKEKIFELIKKNGKPMWILAKESGISLKTLDRIRGGRATEKQVNKLVEYFKGEGLV